MECEYLPSCGFFLKYQNSKQLACKGFIALYCKGARMDDCERKKILLSTGVPPVPDLMPNGVIMQEKK